MLLLEQNDEWLVGRRYLSETSMTLVLANASVMLFTVGGDGLALSIAAVGGTGRRSAKGADRPISIARGAALGLATPLPCRASRPQEPEPTGLTDC
jgi:hypothetical protein